MIHERANDDGQAHSNIYLGKVNNVEPSLDAAFVDLGTGKNGFIHVDELIRDKGSKARIEQVLKPGQEILVQITKESIRDKGPALSILEPSWAVFGVHAICCWWWWRFEAYR